MSLHPRPSPPSRPFEPGIASLACGRVHEATGPGRRAFAAAMAGDMVGETTAGGPGAVLWILDTRQHERLCPTGLARLFDPARLIIARPTGPLAALQVMEEALRSGAAPLVIAELEAAPDLTQSRRLQLAASTGAGRGLCLVPEGRLTNNAAETRWHCTPIAAPTGSAPTGIAPTGIAPDEATLADAAPLAPRNAQGLRGALQHWTLVKNKRGPLGAWEVSLASAASAPSGVSSGAASSTSPVGQDGAATQPHRPIRPATVPLGVLRTLSA